MDFRLHTLIENGAISYTGELNLFKVFKAKRDKRIKGYILD